MKTLNDKILLAVGRYYMHRAAQRTFLFNKAMHDLASHLPLSCSYAAPKGEMPKWDKEADLAAIEKCLPANIGLSACCGTFWFSIFTKSKKTYLQIELNEHDYLDGGKRTKVPYKSPAK